MQPPEPEPTGVLVVRVWLEGPPAAGFRARITSTPDVHVPSTAAAAGSADEVLAAVRGWLDAFLATSVRAP